MTLSAATWAIAGRQLASAADAAAASWVEFPCSLNGSSHISPKDEMTETSRPSLLL